MIAYAQAAQPAVLWPEPMETVWRMLPGGVASVARFKRPDITISDRLFIFSEITRVSGKRTCPAFFL